VWYGGESFDFPWPRIDCWGGRRRAVGEKIVWEKNMETKWGAGLKIRDSVSSGGIAREGRGRRWGLKNNKREFGVSFG